VVRSNRSIGTLGAAPGLRSRLLAALLVSVMVVAGLAAQTPPAAAAPSAAPPPTWTETIDGAIPHLVDTRASTGETVVSGALTFPTTLGRGAAAVALEPTPGTTTSPLNLDGFVASYRPDRTLRWAVPIKGVGKTTVSALAVNQADGSVVVAGVNDPSNPTTFGTAPASITASVAAWIARIGPDGTLLSVTTPTSGTPTISDLDVEASGGVVAVASFAGSVAWNGHSASAASAADVLLIHTDATGAVDRLSAEGVTLAPSTGPDVSVGPGDVANVAFTLAGTTAVVRQHGADGSMAWSYSPSGPAWVNDVDTLADGRVAIAGGHVQLVDFGPGGALPAVVHGRGFLAMLSAAGAPLWAHPATGDQGSVAAVRSSGSSLTVIGQFSLSATITDGTSSVTLTGAYVYGNTAVARYDDSGTLAWATKGDWTLEPALAVDDAGVAYLAGKSGSFASRDPHTSFGLSPVANKLELTEHQAGFIAAFGGATTDHDLEIALTVNANEDGAGTVTYHLTVTNAGPDPVQDVRVGGPIPQPDEGPYSDATLLSATPSQGSFEASFYGEWYVGTLAAGGAATLELVIDVDVWAACLAESVITVAAPLGTETDDTDNTRVMPLAGVPVYPTSGNGVLWSVRGGGAGANPAYDIAAATNGDTFTAGSTVGAATFGTVNVTTLTTAAFITRTKADGTTAWVRTSGGSGTAQAYAVTHTAGGRVVVAGLFSGTVTFGSGGSQVTMTSVGGDGFVAAYDSLGFFQWAKRITGADLQQVVDATSVGDNVFLTGVVRGDATFEGSTPRTISANGSGNSTGFVASYTSAGEPRWAQAISSPGVTTTAPYIAANVAGNVTTVGRAPASTPLGAGGGVIPTPADGTYIARYDTDGAAQWVVSDGATAVPNAIAVSPSGDVAIAGGGDAGGGTFPFGAGADPVPDGGWVARYGVDGGFLWATSLAGDADSLGVALSPSGAVRVTGTFRGPVSYAGTSLQLTRTMGWVFDEPWIASLDPDGVPATLRALPTIDRGVPENVVLHADGTTSISGTFNGEFSGAAGGVTVIGPGPLCGAGGEDVFTARFVAETRLVGTVKNAAGDPLPGIQVAVMTNAQTAIATFTTDAAGRFAAAVPAGTYRLRYYDPAGAYERVFTGDGQTFQGATATPIAAGATAMSTMVLAPRPPGAIIGNTRLGDGGPIAGINIAVFDNSGVFVAAATSNATGGFWIGSLRPGTYRVRFWDPQARVPTEWYQDRAGLLTSSPVAVAAAPVNASPTLGP